MEEISKTKNSKKSRGRPPKNKNVKLSRDNPDMNVNKHDIVPASAIQTASEYDPPNKNHPVLLEAENPETWMQLFVILKDNGIDFINITFDKAGITVTTNQNDDMARICVRLYTKDLRLYQVQKSITIRVDTEQLYKIFKRTKAKSRFSMYLYDDMKDLNIIILSDNKKKDKKWITKLQTNERINQKPPKVSNSDYDLIYMLESTEFQDACKDMSEFKIKTFMMSADNKEANIIWSGDKTDCIVNVIGGDSDIVFCKKLKSATQCIQYKYKLNVFLKYSKAAKFSKMVKIYLSSDGKFPTIFEYDIDPGFGVFQIFVEYSTE